MLKRQLYNLFILCFLIILGLNSLLIHRQIMFSKHAFGAPNADSVHEDQTFFHLTISVITFNRLFCLQRLLVSLSRAQYKGRVDLRINVEAGAPSDLVLYVETFKWLHGEKFVYLRVVRAGLIPAIVESWYPSHDQAYGLLLEDDLEVSPYFHEWLISALLMLQYSDMRNRVFGISLYTPRVIETVNPFKIYLPDVELPGSSSYLHQLPCSWGAMFFPHAWKSYVKYLHHRLATNGSLIVPNSRTNGWIGSWKKYYIELAWAEALFMLYPNYKNQTSFSTNYVEQGAHVVSSDKQHTQALYTVPLHNYPVRLNQKLSPPLPMLDMHGNLYQQGKSANDAQEHCRQISAGHTGTKSGSSLKSEVFVGNKLVSGYVLPPGYKLVSIPRNDSYYVGTMTSNGLFEIDHCSTGRKHQCYSVGKIGMESTLPNLSLYIDETGKVVIASYGCIGNGCRPAWQSKGGRSCAVYVLHLQDTGVLTLHCGCGCHVQEPIWMSGKGSYQAVRCSAKNGAQPVLLPQSPLSSLHLNTLLSEEWRDGSYVEAVMQADGNFVLYRNPSPSVHPVFSIPTYFHAESYTFQLANDGNLFIVGQLGQQHYVLWDNGFHGMQTVPHFLTVNHCGTLTVYEGYGACEHGVQVWTSSSDAACSNLPPHCLDPAAAQKQQMCGQMTPDIYSFLASQLSFTVMLTTLGKTPAQLERSIRHYSLHHMVTCILVVYLRPFEQEVGPFFMNGKLVKYLHTYTGSMNNRFFPSAHLTTEAVLMLDEGLLVHHDDIKWLFESWTHHKDKLVGFFPHSIKRKNGAGVTVMSTKATMLHKSLLYRYACSIGQTMHKIVDRFKSCEDIALNLLASQITSEPLSLYVQPSHIVDAPGPSGAGSLRGLGSLATSQLPCLQHMEDLLNLTLPSQALTPKYRSIL
jgi:hypothetical protein